MQEDCHNFEVSLVHLSSPRASEKHLISKQMARKKTECHSSVWQLTLGQTMGNTPHYEQPQFIPREGPPTRPNANGGGMGACDLCFMGA